jgi:hypothetical protein
MTDQPTAPQVQEPEYVDVDEGKANPPAPPAPATPVQAETFEEWPQDQLLKAQQELKDMQPADLLHLHQIVLTEHPEEYPYPEMLGIMFTTLVSPNGGKYNLTARGATASDAVDNLAIAVRYAQSKYKLIPEGYRAGTQSVPAQTPPPAPVGATPPQAPTPVAQPSQATEQPQAQGTAAEVGTAPLNKIVVMDGKVDFYVGQFKYPFKDSRGPAVVAGLFDPDLGWTKEHFAGPVAQYEKQHLGDLKVDWAKETNPKTGKSYYNVKRVHA